MSMRFFYYLLIAGLTLFLTACGGGSSNSTSSQTTGSGSVALLFTDAPNPAFDEINVTVTHIDLISDDGATTELFSGEKTINLLDLQNNSDIFSYTGNIPARAYSELRLDVSHVELIRKDADGNVTETIIPKLPAGHIDLNPQGTFDVLAGQTLTLQIDIDAQKSIHIVTLGNGGYIFRPVVFIKRLVNTVDGKVIRLAGEITNLDTDAQQFQLCRTTIAQQELISDSSTGLVTRQIDDSSDIRWCPLIHMTDASVIFGPDGEPLASTDLAEGSQATVFGRFALNLGSDEKPALNALTILVGPAGTYAKYDGTTASAVDSTSNRFDLDLDPGQGIDTTNPIPVQLQPGAMILSNNGAVLDASAIVTGQIVKVIGVLTLSDTDPDFIKAAMVFVDTNAANTKLSGTVSAITTALDGFTLMSDSVGDVCVSLTSSTHIYLISEDASGFSSDEIVAADLAESQQADVYGQYNLGGCLVADNILAGAL